ncbi:unnamed protein product, partial [Polarella glacialis]
MPRLEVAADALSFNAAISACKSCGLWQAAQTLLRKMGEVRLAPTTISYNAAISACSQARRWELAVGLLREMQRPRICRGSAAEGATQRDDLSYTGAVRAVERGSCWPQAVLLLSEMLEELPAVRAPAGRASDST